MNEFQEQVLGKWVRRIQVLGVECLCVVNVLHRPLLLQVGLDDVPETVEHEAVVFHARHGLAELAISRHDLGLGVHEIVAGLVRVSHDRHRNVHHVLCRKAPIEGQKLGIGLAQCFDSIFRT